MKPTIEQLWNGSIEPCDICGNDQKFTELACLMERNRNDLNEQLSKAQKETFEKYIDCAEEYQYLLTAQAFSEGFSLASKLWAEALS